MWRMRARSWTLTMLVPMAAPAPPAAAPRHAQPRAVPAASLIEGTLRFDGRATTGEFVGTTTHVTGAVLASPDYASIRGFVEAPVASLRTGNGLRDRDLQKSMEVERYPTMRYDLSGATRQSTAGPDSVSLLLHGTLHLHGVSRPVDVPVTVLRSGEGARVLGTFALDVTDFGVGGLRKMGGLLRMREQIAVHLALRFVAGG